MWQQRGRLAEVGLATLVVTFESSSTAADYLRRTGVQWPLIVDAGRQMYRAYGMDRAPRRAVWSGRSVLAYARLLASGRRLQRASGDVRQRGGDVLIDPRGTIHAHHVGDGPADRLPVAELLDGVGDRPG